MGCRVSDHDHGRLDDRRLIGGFYPKGLHMSATTDQRESRLPPKAKPEAPTTKSGRAGQKVTVACKHPPGIVMRVFEWNEEDVPVFGGGVKRQQVARPTGDQVVIHGPGHPFGELPRFAMEGGYALTTNVDAEVWDTWYEQNRHSDLVKNNVIKAYEKPDMAADWAKRDKLRGGGVVATVMSNLGLERFLKARKLILERTPVGDRSVMARMREGGFNLGGEQSGHIILSDFSTTGDGLLAALQVLAVLKESDKPMSALARQFEPVPQKLENVRFASGKPLENAEVMAVMADAEQRLNGCGRILVRASGTEPLIRIMAEGDDEKLVSQVVKEIAGAVKKAAVTA